MTLYRASRHHANPNPGTRQLAWASPQQKQAFEYGPYPLAMSGGWGASKTTLMAIKFAFLMDTFPGYRVLIARRVWDDLKRTTMATFFKWIPPQAYIYGGRRADGDKVLRLNNGSEILWMHLDDPETADVIKGVEINGFGIDQAEDVEEDHFDNLTGRLNRWDQCRVPDWLLKMYEDRGDRWPYTYPGTDTPAPPSFAILTCNPDHLLHWIYRRFHEESPEYNEPRFDKDGNSIGSYKDQGYLNITMPSDSNKFLDRRNLAALANRDESFQRRYRRGEWGIPEGQIHEVSDYNLLEVEPEFIDWIRRSCTLHRTLDHGDSAPTCCLWWAVDRNGNIFCYREYYQPDRLVSQHRVGIYERSRLEPRPDSILEPYVFNIADPAIFNKTAQRLGGRYSISDEWEDCTNQPRNTAVFWMAGDNDELGTRNRISEYLRLDKERVHPITGKLGSPRLFFVKRTDKYPGGCFHVIRETRSQRRVKIGSEMGKPIFSDERDDKIVDHAYDALRYFIASRPPVASVLQQGPGAGTLSAIDKQLAAFERAGGQQSLATEAARISGRRHGRQY